MASIVQPQTTGLSLQTINDRLKIIEQAFQNGVLHQPGDIKIFGGNTPTKGWLLCDGRLVQAITYPALDEIIGSKAGYPFSAGVKPTVISGGDQFKLPNLLGRIPIGAGIAADPATIPAASNLVLGVRAGQASYALAATEMPNHNHGGVTGTGSTGSGTTGTESAFHLHNLTGDSVTPAVINLQTGATGINVISAPLSNQTSSETATHTHSVPSLSVPALTIAGAGGGIAFPLYNPYQVVNFYIRAI